jgi:hypothetical protein
MSESGTDSIEPIVEPTTETTPAPAVASTDTPTDTPTGAPTGAPVVDVRADVQRVGGVEVEARPDGYSVAIRLNAPAPDADWIKLFEHPPVLLLLPPARRPELTDTVITISVRNEEQMTASIRYAELALAEANQVYNDEVLPRRERHRKIRESIRANDESGLDAMARAANSL